MTGICRNCEEQKKVHEDFEWADEAICWECGDRIIELLGNNMAKLLDEWDKHEE